MRPRLRKLLALIAFLSVSLLLLSAAESHAQYMFLDVNSDSTNGPADTLGASGAFSVAIWLVTDHNRNGEDAYCASQGDLTINSYTVILRAVGGDVSWGSYTNARPGMTTSFGTKALGSDFYTGYGGGSQLSPGMYKLGTINVSVILGHPALEIVPSTALRPGRETSFGSACTGARENNTLSLGIDWQDADGVASGSGSGEYAMVQAEGPGFLFYGGNEIEGPWTLSYTEGGLSINGYTSKAPREPAASRLSVAQRTREMAFLRSASSFADSLKETNLEVSDATKRLEDFCRANDVGAVISSTSGKVQVLLPSGVAVVLSSRRVSDSRVKRGAAPATNSNGAILQTIARYLRQGAGILITDVGVWTLVPASRANQVRQAILGAQRGGDADTTALKSLPARDRSAVRSPATLVRVN